MLPYSLIFVMTVMGSVGSIFLKRATDSFKGDTVHKAVVNLLKTADIYIGGLLYVTAAVINIIVLRFLDYSIVLPLTAFTYVWTIFLAKWKFNETITKNKLIGMALVVIGAVLVSRV